MRTSLQCLTCGTVYKRRPSVAGKFCSRECAGIARREPRSSVADRLWKHVEKTETCWLWTGYCDRAGYGTIQIAKAPALVHRVSYEIHVGQIPSDKIVRHTCDVRNCVRPDHLLIGTSKDNST